MNIKEASKAVGLSDQSLRKLEIIFNLSIPRGSNGRIYNADLIEIFKKIKELKDNNIPTEEIKKQINETTLYKTSYNLNTDLIQPYDFKAMIKAEIQEITALSEKYATAAHKIGRLEAEKASLEEKVKLLPAPDDFYKLQTGNKILQAENEALRKENELLKNSSMETLF